MRVLCLSAAVLAAVVSSANAQSAAPAAAPAAVATAPVTLTAKEIADLNARLTTLDRALVREWLAVMRERRPDVSASQTDMANGLIKNGSLQSMSPLSDKHRELQIERSKVEEQLMAAGQKIRYPSFKAKAAQK